MLKSMRRTFYLAGTMVFIAMFSLAVYAAETTRVDCTSIELNDTWQDYTLEVNTYAYSQLYLPDNGKLVLTIQTWFNTQQYVKLLDQDYNEIDSCFVQGDTSAEAKNTEFSYNLTQGTYFAVVESWNNASGLYRIKAKFTPAGTDETEPNDSFSEAMPLATDALPVQAFLSSKTTTAFYPNNLPEGTQDFCDYYSFVKDTDTCAFYIAPLEKGSNLHAIIYDSFYQVKWERYLYGDSFFEEIDIPAGSYYAEVEPSDSLGGIYAIGVFSENVVPEQG